MMNKSTCRLVLGAGKLINKFRDGNSKHQGNWKKNILLTRIEGGKTSKNKVQKTQGQK